MALKALVCLLAVSVASGCTYFCRHSRGYDCCDHLTPSYSYGSGGIDQPIHFPGTNNGYNNHNNNGYNYHPTHRPRPPFTTYRPRPPIINHRPPVITSRPPVITHRPPFNRPPVITNRPPVNGNINILPGGTNPEFNNQDGIKDGIKTGECPITGHVCLRKASPPKCEQDLDCSGILKCCFDVCLQRDTCLRPNF